MNWGSFTPEFSNENEFVYVYNHFISNKESIERTLNFIIGKIVWWKIYYKKEIKHTVIIDDVGQPVTEDTREYFRKALADYASQTKFMSESN